MPTRLPPKAKVKSAKTAAPKAAPKKAKIEHILSADSMKNKKASLKRGGGQKQKRPAMTPEQILEYNQAMHRLHEQKTVPGFKTGETGGVLKSTNQWKMFLRVLSETAVVSKACIAANISRDAAYDYKRADKDFSTLWDEAYERGWLKMEEEIQRRAFEGNTRPLYRNGLVVDWVKECSDQLAMFVLKGRMRKIYGDRQEITVSNASRPYAKLSDEEVEALLAQRLGGGEE